MGEYETFLEERKGKSTTPNKLANRIKPMHIIIIAVLIFLGNMMIKNNPENSKMIWLSVGGIGILYLFSISRGQEQKKAIPQNIAKRLASDDLRKDVSEKGSYPIGTTIYPTGYFKAQSWDSGEGWRLFKYNIGFSVDKPNSPPEEIIYQMDPFEGRCMGIVKSETGFTGEEFKDIQMIFPEKVITETDNKKDS